MTEPMTRRIVSRSYDIRGERVVGEVVVRMSEAEWERLCTQGPDYSVFYEWCVANFPHAVELCPYKFSIADMTSNVTHES